MECFVKSVYFPSQTNWLKCEGMNVWEEICSMPLNKWWKISDLPAGEYKPVHYRLVLQNVQDEYKVKGLTDCPITRIGNRYQLVGD